MNNSLRDKVKIWASYYRFFPHKFAKDYLKLSLKPFQQIIVFFMMHFNYLMYVASRGQGKTWLTAVFSVIRCILYPGTKVVIASGIKSQALEVIQKIEEMQKESPNLKREISELSTGINSAGVDFHNGSWIKIVASTDGARGKRANLLIIDEFRLVDLDVINTVLRKFNASSRQPGFLKKQEYKGNEKYLERNKEIYLSSAWFKIHWSWARFLAYLEKMSEGHKYFVCGLPYQIAVKEGLYNKAQAQDEMSESDFDPIAWSMEMDALFYGENSKAFFKLKDIMKIRTLQLPMYSKEFYDAIRLPNVKYTPPTGGEIHVLSCDIAVASGSDNDNTVFAVLKLVPSKQGYERRIFYIETMNGGHSVVQANRIKQLFYDFDCSYVALDTKGVGFGVYDQLVIDSFDKERGVEYKAWTCFNDSEMANRCNVIDAPPVIYSIKADVKLNSAMAFSLRDKIKRGKIKMLLDENKARQNLLSIKTYSQLSVEEQVEVELPFKQTSALVNEMINLKTEVVQNQITLKESGSMRKDRYTAIGYANLLADKLEKELLDNLNADSDNWGQYANLW